MRPDEVRRWARQKISSVLFSSSNQEIQTEKTSGTKLSRRKRKADQILSDDGDWIDVQELSTRFHTMAEREREMSRNNNAMLSRLFSLCISICIEACFVLFSRLTLVSFWWIQTVSQGERENHKTVGEKEIFKCCLVCLAFVDFSLKALSDGKNKTDALYPGTHVLQSRGDAAESLVLHLS